jgi:hypothetical protein
MHSIYHLVLPALLLAAPLLAQLPAQLRLSALSETQFGNLPEGEPSGLKTSYHQLSLDYALEGFQIGLRGEGFGSSEPDRNYGELLQRFASYRRGPLQATIGHFYTIVGSGILAHAFELPGVITEERGSRRRYQIVRDLDGAHVRYRAGRATVQLLRGTPINTNLPPGLNGIDRRQGTIQGGSLQLKTHKNLDTGFSMLHYDIGGQEETGAALNARWRLAPLLAHLGLKGLYADLHGEYAQRDVTADRLFSLDRDLGRALYLSSSLTWGAWGASLEYKDYEDFSLSQVNNPPPLIREHAAYLLNRNTHDLLADDEQGYQAELSYTFAGGQALTANFTRAVRRHDIGDEDDKTLREIFLQFDSPVGEYIDAQLFADFSRNYILENEKSQLYGTLWNWSFNDRHTLNFDTQFQDVERRFGTLDFPYTNLYLNLEAHRAPGLSAAIQLQRTTDELETGADPSGTTWWWGLNFGAEIRDGHSVGIFAGQRRSGLACTAGTCYEVLGFEGVEMRLHNRFF